MYISYAMDIMRPVPAITQNFLGLVRRLLDIFEMSRFRNTRDRLEIDPNDFIDT